MRLCFVVGENGSGKSNRLAEIANRKVGKQKIILICNTVHDKYDLPKSVLKLTNRHPESIPANVIKRSLLKLYSKGPSLLNKIGRVLDYCGYRRLLVVHPQTRSDGDFDSFLEEFSDLRDSSYRANSIGLARSIAGRKDLFSEINFDSFGGGADEAINWLFAEDDLKKLKAVTGMQILIERKNGLRIPLEHASSGELTLMSMLIFVMANIDANTLLLIDEPENSLHPQWQKDYIKKLDELVYLYNPEVVVATHAPIVVSGAQADKNNSINIYHAGIGKYLDVEDSMSKSVEETLWSLFDTVSPDNNYLSELLVKTISSMNDGRITLSDVIREINELRAASYASEQEEMFDAAIALARQVASE